MGDEIIVEDEDEGEGEGEAGKVEAAASGKPAPDVPSASTLSTLSHEQLIAHLNRNNANPYAGLGLLGADATLENVKKVGRKLQLMLHPDKSGKPEWPAALPGATGAFQAVTAYKEKIDKNPTAKYHDAEATVTCSRCGSSVRVTKRGQSLFMHRGLGGSPCPGGGQSVRDQL